MSDNGKPKIALITATLDKGSISIKFGKANLALISHALRLTSLQLDNIIISNEQSKIIPTQGNQVLGKSIIDKIRRGPNG